MNFKLGSDPELMLVDRESGLLRSAIPIIAGTKDKPLVIEDGVVIHDNVNLEFGIKPADSEKEWVERTGGVLNRIRKMLPPNLKMRAIACADFPESELQYPEALEFACDPDFDPYDFTPNMIDDDAPNGTLRSCGGHVHIGDNFIIEDPDDIDKQADAAKMMDVFLGIPSLLLDKDPTSHRRRKLYGKAGAHRPKPYGIEYRSTGNFWVSSPELTKLVYKLTRDGLAAWKAAHLEAIQWALVRSTINENNLVSAEKALKGLILPLLQQDTRSLLADCLDAERADLESAWKI